MHALIAVLPGDGIGSEVTAEAVRVLERIGTLRGHEFRFESALVGGAAIDATGEALPPATLELCRRADAILLGAVGGPRWSDPSARVRPEQGLLALRKALELFANLRPVVPHPAVLDASPIKAELLTGVDILVVRELTGGIYFGEKRRTDTEAVDVCRYTVPEIERVVRMAAALARGRRRTLVSVDKANVLETSRLWRSVVERILPAEFPEVRFEHMLVDAAAMHLIRRPRDFDVLVTENMFGDILTDEASMLAGSMGLLPSASLGASGRDGLYRGGLFEPIHGSAPDIAGRGIANPYAALLSAALLLKYSLGLEIEARAVESAVAAAIDSGARTADLASRGSQPVSTRTAGDAVLAELRALR
ncbi:MAG TPA: 3-isopropylmalate dehydrogenase [Steroidobacteraceae bacterium]|nr:3-isopropylmalate dehydrogenase [Steroidobacteraceae bacterium]